MTRRALLCSLCRVIRGGCVASFVFSKLGLFCGSDYSKMRSDMCVFIIIFNDSIFFNTVLCADSH